MKRSLMIVVTSIAIDALALVTLVATAGAQAHIPLPFEESGVLNTAPYKIRVPANWNATLLVFAHGYRDRSDHPGEVDNRNAEAAPGGTPFENVLLAQGYALAGSAFRTNGFAVKEGVQNTLALTNFFSGKVGPPARVIVWGVSLGSYVTLESVEKFPGVYNGGIALCSGGAGTPRTVDHYLDFQIAYDVTFGWPPSWGQPGEVRNDLDFESEVFPVLFAQVTNPSNFPKFEFIRRTTGMPSQDFLANGGIFSTMFFATEAGAELQRRAGGRVAQNLDHFYDLTAADKAFLLALGLDANPLLAAMNARRIVADPNARSYVKHNAEFHGQPKASGAISSHGGR